MADAIECLIAAMDALDAPDEDMEPYLAGSPGHGCPVDAEADHAGGIADDEPSLGAPERHVPRKGQEAWADGGSLDRWSVDREVDDDENEPSLGSVAMTEYWSQEGWSLGADDDSEDEHDGREPGGDSEDELGATTAMNQDHAWANHCKGWSVSDGEPDLGWTEERSGAGHPETAMRGYDDDREQENEHGGDIQDQPHDCEPDVEPMCDVLGGAHNRGPYRPSVNVIGDRDLDAGPRGYLWR
jgi:hypothetical protein